MLYQPRALLCNAIMTLTLFLLDIFPRFTPDLLQTPDTKERLHRTPSMFLVDFGWKMA